MLQIRKNTDWLLIITIVVVVWRVLVTAMAQISVSLFPFRPTFPYATELIAKAGSRLVAVWAHFDGVHYLTIADHGYEGTGLIQAFFPAYPMLLKMASFNGLFNQTIVGVILSTVCLILALYIWSKLMVVSKESNRTILWAMVLLLSFPTAFFFTSVYSESLFLLTTGVCFYFLIQKKWYVAGLAGALAAFTRVTGVFLTLAIGYEIWRQRKILSIEMVASLLPLMGLGVFMLYLQKTFGDALLFAHVQTDFGAGRETAKLVLLYQVFYRYAKMMITVPIKSWAYYQVLQELGASLFAIVGMGLSFFKLNKTYLWYMVPAFLLPTLTGTFSSMPRYVVVLFPLFWALATLRSTTVKVLLVLIFSVFQIINIFLFTQGLWVA